MPKVEFKGDHAKITIQGRDPITRENLTYEKYLWLVSFDPRYEAFFEVTPDKQQTKDDKVHTKKSKGNDLESK